jgi:hypothetical protein
MDKKLNNTTDYISDNIKHSDKDDDDDGRILALYSTAR